GLPDVTRADADHLAGDGPGSGEMPRQFLGVLAGAGLTVPGDDVGGPALPPTFQGERAGRREDAGCQHGAAGPAPAEQVVGVDYEHHGALLRGGLAGEAEDPLHLRGDVVPVVADLGRPVDAHGDTAFPSSIIFSMLPSSMPASLSTWRVCCPRRGGASAARAGERSTWIGEPVPLTVPATGCSYSTAIWLCTAWGSANASGMVRTRPAGRPAPWSVSNQCSTVPPWNTRASSATR